MTTNQRKKYASDKERQREGIEHACYAMMETPTMVIRALADLDKAGHFSDPLICGIRTALYARLHAATAYTAGMHGDRREVGSAS